jgi:hypothetical protein
MTVLGKSVYRQRAFFQTWIFKNKKMKALAKEQLENSVSLSLEKKPETVPSASSK